MTPDKGSFVLLIDAGMTDEDPESLVSMHSAIEAVYTARVPSRVFPQVLHLYPNAAVHATRARALSPLLVAASGGILKMTREQVLLYWLPQQSPPKLSFHLDKFEEVNTWMLWQ